MYSDNAKTFKAGQKLRDCLGPTNMTNSTVSFAMKRSYGNLTCRDYPYRVAKFHG